MRTKNQIKRQLLFLTLLNSAVYGGTTTLTGHTTESALTEGR